MHTDPNLPAPSADVAVARLSDMVLRLMDIILALGLFLVALLPMILVAVAIKATDRGPVLFLQPRVGRNLKLFKIAKFRTMVHDPARSMGNAQGVVTEKDRAAFQTTSERDPRITKVGRILRPVHLDELPQVFNILLGHMSLVGVRPDVPVQVLEYTAQEWVDRHVLPPGITGWAQISPNIANMADRTAHDLYWVRNRSIALYVKIVLRTFAKVLQRNSL